MPKVSPTRGPGALLLRLRVARRQRELDSVLAQRADPSASPELEWRAHQLAQVDTRRQLANILTNLIDAAEEPAVTWAARGIDSPIRSHAVLNARDELIALANRLKDPAPVRIHGIALAAQLVLDGRHSPSFVTPDIHDVADWTRRALAAMDD